MFMPIAQSPGMPDFFTQTARVTSFDHPAPAQEAVKVVVNQPIAVFHRTAGFLVVEGIFLE